MQRPMAAQILRAEEIDGQFVVVVWLDTGKVVYETAEVTLVDGTRARARVGPGRPDPEWVHEERWGLDVNPAHAVDQTLQNAKFKLEETARAKGEPIRHALSGSRVDLSTFVPSFKKDE